MKAKQYTEKEILSAARIGLEFEFYSKLSDINIARSLGDLLNKRVVIPVAISALGAQDAPVYHSPIKVSDELFKLEPDFSGGSDMFELITGPCDMKEAKSIINKVLTWIDQYGYTNERCSVHANVSFDLEKVDPLNKAEDLNILKFILSFDEDKVYDAFPNREFSVYARSIMEIIPNKVFFYNNLPVDLDFLSVLTVPNEKYFGVNFTKKDDGYLEFRYMGGRNYEKKPKKILDTIDHFVLSYFNVLNSNEYTEKEKKALDNIIGKHAELVRTFADYKLFKKTHDKLEVTVDLSSDDQVIKSFWSSINSGIFNLMVNSGMRAGRINYDTEFGMFQIADAKLKNAKLYNMDIVECEIEGIIRNCNIYYSTIKHSRINESDAVRENKFIDCRIENLSLHATNECKGCFIDNKDKPINCKVSGGVIRRGHTGSTAEIADNVIIVPGEGNTETKDINRDLKWFKNVAKKSKNKSEDNDKE